MVIFSFSCLGSKHQLLRAASALENNLTTLDDEYNKLSDHMAHGEALDFNHQPLGGMYMAIKQVSPMMVVIFSWRSMTCQIMMLFHIYNRLQVEEQKHFIFICACIFVLKSKSLTQVGPEVWSEHETVHLCATWLQTLLKP